MTTRLDIINNMLAAIGTAALVSTDDRHPNYIKADIKLTAVLSPVQNKGYWFNSGKRTFRADVQGRVILPENILHADPVNRALNYTLRGRYLYNIGEGTDVIGADVLCSVVERVSVEDMPPEAQEMVRASAVYMFYLDYPGVEPKLSTYAGIAGVAAAALRAAHLKNKDINFFDGASAAQLRRTSGARSRITY